MSNLTCYCVALCYRCMYMCAKIVMDSNFFMQRNFCRLATQCVAQVFHGRIFRVINIHTFIVRNPALPTNNMQVSDSVVSDF